MPTYRYRRPDGTTFEVLQKISDAPLTEDPETGVPVQRVISGGAGLQFKGSGFYLTDYTDKGKSPASGSPSGESSESSGTKKTEAKASDSKASTASE
ncbi:MAG: FmdB family zinc ribbon protein [Bacteroidota bacterium]